MITAAFAAARLRRLLREPPPSRAHVAVRFDLVGAALRGSRVYAFENFRDSVTGELCGRQCYEWAAPGITAQIHRPEFDRMSYREAGAEGWIEPFSRGEMMSLDLDQAGDLHELMESQDVKSMLVAPVIGPDGWIGFVGVDDCVRRRNWRPRERELLGEVARAYGSVG